MGAFFSSARAIAMRWRSPPESFEPALAHRRVVALRQRHDELVRIGRSRRALDLLARGAAACRTRCCRDGVAEQRAFLQHDADLVAQTSAA